MLAVDGLTVRYGAVVALREVSLHVDDGELVALVGPNGAGKTTLLNTVAGVLRPAGGRITLAGKDVTGAEPATLVRRGLALVPEHRRIFRDLTVGENLQLAGVTVRPADRRRRLDEARARFDVLAGRWNTAAGYLSGGEAQQLAIARALMSDPRLVLLDEPTLGPRPGHGRHRLRPARRAARAGSHDPRRRAERAARPRDRRPGLRPPHRTGRPRGFRAAELAAHEDSLRTYVMRSRRGVTAVRWRHSLAAVSSPVTTFVQSLVDGLGRGSTYALLALGITLIFGVMHLVNFAHAELITVGAYVAYFLSTNGVDWWLIAPAIVIAAVIASVATELVAFRWVRNASPFTLLLTSFALERLSHALWAVFVSPTKKSFAGPGWAFNTVEIGDVRFEVMDIVTIAVTAVVLALTAFVFRRTLFGLVGAGRERGLRRRPVDGRAGQRGDRERVRVRRAAGGRGRRC